MGSGFRKKVKLWKQQQAMEKATHDAQEIINNPDGAFQKMAKPLIEKLQVATYQQNRLSALLCAVIDQNNGTITIKRKDIDKFAKHSLTIMHESAVDDDGVNPEIDLTFTYKAEPIASKQPDIPPPPAEPVAVNDLGNTPAAQAQMDALAEQADAAQ